MSGLKPSQAKFLAWMTDGAMGAVDGSVVFAGELTHLPKMVGVRILENIRPPVGRGPSVHLVLSGPLCGTTDAVLLDPDQTEELATRLNELAAKARSMRRKVNIS
jgi:hypothetical protein